MSNDTSRHIEQFLNYINRIHTNIEYSFENADNQKINFLDVTLGRTNFKINFFI